MPLALATQAQAAITSIAFTALALTLPCAAQTAAPAAAALQNLDTALLASNCTTCHGPGGQPPAGGSGSIPALRGQGSAALLERMQAFKAGRVAGATVMPLLMQGYDAAQMQALAQWFAQPAKAKP